MKRYDSYKDSRVEWIGMIPLEWTKTKLKYILQNMVTGGTPDTFNDSYWGNEEKGINWISISDITSNGREITETKKFISEKGLDSKKLKILPVGSLIYSIYGSIGKISRLGIPSTIHQGILGLKTNSNYDTTFLEYYLIYFKEYVSLFSSSNTQENLNQEKVSNFDITVPPLSEQQQIVSFLDTKTSLIDSLIEITQQKIELLEEKRTSLINKVVTKGLNPNVEMKDSGVEWIGEIPKIWSVSKIVFISKKVTDGSHHSPETQDSGKLYVTVSNISKSNDIDFESCSKISEESFSELERNGCRPKKGDVLITKDGTIGRGLVVGDFNEYVILSSIGLIRFSKKINPDYGLYYLLSGLNIDQMYSHVRGSGITRLTINLIKNLLFVIPTLSEQQQIVEYLDEQTQLIDNTISIEEKRIELLKEYRQSLISEVVTGKRKVV